MSNANDNRDETLQYDSFAMRHIGPSESEIDSMLAALDLRSLEELRDSVVPPQIRSGRGLDLPGPLSEPAAIARLRELAAENRPCRSFIGMGYYGTHMPEVIKRNLFENPGWYTAYTPYQPEVSQGRLEALINFQQMIVDLTGLEAANASLLDEATAAAEAMAMARRSNKTESARFFVEASCHPQTIAVLETRADHMGIELVYGDDACNLDDLRVFGGIIQYPATDGGISRPAQRIKAIKERGGLAIVATDLLALCVLMPPGELDADIAVGSSQRFGVPMGYGGPHAAFFATRNSFRRSMPGRLIGVSLDARGQNAYRMALQTREQHIRREKATSNICTAQVLLAVIAGMYAVYHGPDGLRSRAAGVHRLASAFVDGLQTSGFDIRHSSFFDTVTIAAPGNAERIIERARSFDIELRLLDRDHLSVSIDETTGSQDIRDLLSAIADKNWSLSEVEELVRKSSTRLPSDIVRKTPYLDHPVFHTYRSETEMMRYLRRLQAKDIALDRSMIPLGSCTMKLNAATEMAALSWPEFADVHPFVPEARAAGYRTLIEELQRWLAAITGFDEVSMQPNAGSQGEYTGLLAIRGFHEKHGERRRDICLIPSSAHGTNPASAIMAGLRVVVVRCDNKGNIDIDDLRRTANEHADRLAAMMITYPSTHGVFEDRIKEACDIIHDLGGQVYLDGANLNALMGLCRPGEFGADVAHINLHKTFCIPHGGGGPGMGPIGVKSHLAPFLPDHPVVRVRNREETARNLGTVAAAPWGSPLILPISWAFVAMMGSAGLERASLVAILNANYVAHRLRNHFPVVFEGRGGFVAHECIIDFRRIKERTGVSAEDVAKRLMDYGFHAPTMSWPVPETMMIEPTESENKQELDRFCDALIAIRGEIRAIEDGDADPQVNLLKNAPHVHSLLLEDWDLPYPRQAAFFPLGDTQDKFWPPVARVDNAYGDRNLVCTCPPVESYEHAAE